MLKTMWISTAENWRKTFDGVIHPIPSRIYWPQFPEPAILSPPLPKWKNGGPRLHRTRTGGEQGLVATRAMTVKCKLCKQSGHNKRSYTMNPNKGKTQEGRKRKMDINATTSTNADLPSPQKSSTWYVF